MTNHLTCKIVAVKGEMVEIQIEGQTITLSKKFFSEVLSEKDQFQLFLFNPKCPNLNEKQLAKSILEEILNGK